MVGWNTEGRRDTVDGGLWLPPSFLCRLNDRSEVHCLVFFFFSFLFFSPLASCICLVRWTRLMSVQSLRAQERRSPWNADHRRVQRCILSEKAVLTRELSVFYKCFRGTAAQPTGSVMSRRRADQSPADGAELCGCVNTDDSMTWCCLGVRHFLKVPCMQQNYEH